MSDIVNSPVQLLQNLESGHFLPKFKKEIEKVIEHLRLAERGSAEIQFKMKFAKNEETLEIAAEVSAKIPKDKPKRTIMFLTQEGNVHVNNPRQLDAFRDMNAGSSRSA